MQEELVYKTIDEQLEMIYQKNILIKNEEKAKDILYRENYYKLITGYKDVFLELKKGEEIFQQETYFEEIYAIYIFDRELRNMMLNYISIIETNLKSCIANQFSLKYGTSHYLKKENFYVPSYKERLFEEFLQKLNDNLKMNWKHYPDLKESKEKYQTIPLWMLTTIMTFGTISKFYHFMKKEDQTEVAKYFCIQRNDMDVFLKMLNIIRNISAHGNVLFDIRLPIHYPIHHSSFFHESIPIEKQENSYVSGINDIMAIIIILKRFLEHKEFKKFMKELKTAILDVKKELDAYSFSCFLKKMGIPETFLEKNPFLSE